MTKINSYITYTCISVFIIYLLQENGDGAMFTPGEKIAYYRLIRQCPQYPKLPWSFKITMKKYNRTTTVYDGSVNLTSDFDDTHTFELEARRWSDGGWKRNHLKIRRNKACSSVMLFYGGLFKEQMAAIGKKNTCPVTKGNFNFYNMPQNLTSPLFIGSGIFNNTIVIRDKMDKIVFCLENILEIMDVIKKTKSTRLLAPRTDVVASKQTQKT